ncbi:Gfo/Idh/MocA family protein [Terriglobus saanensis]|uniref:Oxidoreductase domain protein n=1 Tax=Terriglobus saanensis (strain ATCC BAA-1853 / DSM 23119 / SP1PR4) TaxID=401053 RepID=E8V0X0_TERSS|nr:Gfo/Idh/MocA family oxidoreductase [Terriglobus saanensis]ADV82261.1 oxidoreductase domain protein [Terriglobus saanensis SP1PR4]
MKRINEGARADSSRRDFLRLGAVATIGVGATASIPAHALASSTMVNVPFEAKIPRIAIVGVGGRGTSLLKNLLGTDAEIVAICDIFEEKARHAQSLVEAAGHKKPEIYFGNEHSFEDLMKRTDVDLVIVATYWNWHAPIGVAAMESGKHVALEVPAVTTMADCWKIVDTSEKTRKHCLILENCCYGYEETLVLRLTHAGELGELLYGEGAYLHDLRNILFSTQGEGLWRRAEHTKANGNLYPTHGLGPVANYMGIQRGDRFEHMVSMSSQQKGLDLYRKDAVKAGDPRWAERYVTGDMNVSLIKTSLGRTITVKHDVVNPRPYSRVNSIAGTKGVFEDYPPRIYVDGQAGGEKYGSLEAWKKYDHPLWKNEGENAKKMGGHGGMDFLMLFRLVQCMREGLPPDIDVYDAAAWSSIGPLSVRSVSTGSAPVEVPDFTRGHWRDRSASAIALQA